MAEHVLGNVTLGDGPRLSAQIVDELLWIEANIVLAGGYFHNARHSKV